MSRPVVVEEVEVTEEGRKYSCPECGGGVVVDLFSFQVNNMGMGQCTTYSCWDCGWQGTEDSSDE